MTRREAAPPLPSSSSFFSFEIDAAEFCGALHQRNKEIGVVVGDDALEDGGDAFEAHAGVHAGFRQRRERAAGVAIELHEDEIPDFDVAAAVAGKFAIGVAFFGGGRAHVVENFAARAAGAGIAHGPEIIFEAGNGERCARPEHSAQPELARFFVHAKVVAGSDFRAAKHRDIQLVFAECQTSPEK